MGRGHHSAGYGVHQLARRRQIPRSRTRSGPVRAPSGSDPGDRSQIAQKTRTSGSNWGSSPVEDDV